jgi:hypothetical protein
LLGAFRRGAVSAAARRNRERCREESPRVHPESTHVRGVASRRQGRRRTDGGRLAACHSERSAEGARVPTTWQMRNRGVIPSGARAERTRSPGIAI